MFQRSGMQFTLGIKAECGIERLAVHRLVCQIFIGKKHTVKLPFRIIDRCNGITVERNEFCLRYPVD